MDIVEPKIPINISGKATIYEPPIQRLKGKDEDGVYYADFGSPTPPEGAVPDPPTDITVIAWDETFYAYWTPTTGVEGYNISVFDGIDLLYTVQTENDFYEFDESEITLVNDNEYRIIVSGIFKGELLEADQVQFTPTDKTPQNLSVTEFTSESVSISWDDLATSYKDYVVYITNEDTGQLFKTVFGITGTSATITGLIDGTNYSVQVAARSALDVFIGDKTVKEEFTAFDLLPPENFDVSVNSSGIGVCTWTERSGVDGYNIYSQVDDGGYSKVNTEVITGSSYNHRMLAHGTNDVYIVSVFGAGESDPSDAVEVIFNIFTSGYWGQVVNSFNGNGWSADSVNEMLIHAPSTDDGGFYYKPTGAVGISDITIRFRNPNNTNITRLGVMFRADIDSSPELINAYYRHNTSPDRTEIVQSTNIGGSLAGFDILFWSGENRSPNDYLWMRTKVSGDWQGDGCRLQTKVWDDGDPEPEDWQKETTSTSSIVNTTGRIGVATELGSADIIVDRFIVNEIG